MDPGTVIAIALVLYGTSAVAALAGRYSAATGLMLVASLVLFVLLPFALLPLAEF
jgi:hypothetical protein